MTICDHLGDFCLTLRAARAATFFVVGFLLGGAPARCETVIADPAAMLGTARRHDIVGSNELSIEKAPEGVFLRSTPQKSATALYQPVSLPLQALEHVRWLWRVDKLHRTADIRLKSHDDFGAMIAFVFGEPHWWAADVPTIAYVWTSTAVANGTIVNSARLKRLRYVQLRGTADVSMSRLEARNVIADFVSAFGEPPPPLRYIAIFNDNDQTGEPVSAVFGRIVSSR